MEFREVEFRADMLEKHKAERERRAMRAAAFTAYQLGAGQGRAQTFDDYLCKIGMRDKPKSLTAEQAGKIAKRNIEIAEQIRAMDRGRAS